MVKIHGVPSSKGEITNEITMNVAQLVDSEHALQDDDISISHRLRPSREGTIPPIIVKFCRRYTRDRIWNARRSLAPGLLRI